MKLADKITERYFNSLGVTVKPGDHRNASLNCSTETLNKLIDEFAALDPDLPDINCNDDWLITINGIQYSVILNDDLGSNIIVGWTEEIG